MIPRRSPRRARGAARARNARREALGPIVLLASAALAAGACGGTRAPARAAATPPSEGTCVSAWLLDPAEHPHADLIAYRPLTRADFLASAPPASIRAPRRLAAASCSYLVPDPLRIRATPTQDRDDGGYQARPERLHFRARLDRRCSWWNDARPGSADAVLAHEQIHFALAELEARRLNARADEWLRLATARGRSAEGAIAESRRRLVPVLAWGASQLRARQDRFDAETALGRDSAAQARWQQEVSRELAETRGLASAGNAGSSAPGAPLRRGAQSSRSITVPVPSPPPQHMATSP